MDLPIFNNHFWKLVKQLDELTEKIKLDSFVLDNSSASFSAEMIFDVFDFFDSLNFHVQLEEINGQQYIIPNPRSEKIHVEFSFSEWIALQAHFPLMKKFEDYEFHKTLEKKFADVNAKYPQFNLYAVSSEEKKSYNLKENLNEAHKGYVNIIDSAFAAQNVVLVKIENKKYEIYPHKLILLEGELTIIGEETIDRCLISYTLDELSEITINKAANYTPNFSRYEVEEFIMAIRAVSGREERLVLKIDQDNPVDLNPAYQFMGHPYMTANLEGDFIWAASVEVSSDLYDWLITMGESVEILDPLGLKTEFEKYREVKLVEQDQSKLKKAA